MWNITPTYSDNTTRQERLYLHGETSWTHPGQDVHFVEYFWAYMLWRRMIIHVTIFQYVWYSVGPRLSVIPFHIAVESLGHETPLYLWLSPRGWWTDWTNESNLGTVINKWEIIKHFINSHFHKNAYNPSNKFPIITNKFLSLPITITLIPTCI